MLKTLAVHTECMCIYPVLHSSSWSKFITTSHPSPHFFRQKMSNFSRTSRVASNPIYWISQSRTFVFPKRLPTHAQNLPPFLIFFPQSLGWFSLDVKKRGLAKLLLRLLAVRNKNKRRQRLKFKLQSVLQDPPLLKMYLTFKYQHSSMRIVILILTSSMEQSPSWEANWFCS